MKKIIRQFDCDLKQHPKKMQFAIPEDAEFLSAQVNLSTNLPSFWFLCDEIKIQNDEEIPRMIGQVIRTFSMINTDEFFDESFGGIYLVTIQDPRKNGKSYHIFQTS